jgi:hypothetical protein
MDELGEVAWKKFLPEKPREGVPGDLGNTLEDSVAWS